MDFALFDDRFITPFQDRKKETDAVRITHYGLFKKTFILELWEASLFLVSQKSNVYVTEAERASQALNQNCNRKHAFHLWSYSVVFSQTLVSLGVHLFMILVFS